MEDFVGAHRGDDKENFDPRSKNHKAKHADTDRQPTGRGDYVDKTPDEYFDGGDNGDLDRGGPDISSSKRR